MSIALVGGIFLFAFPQIADLSNVWISIKEMTWIEMVTLFAAAVWNIATYWFVMVAALPGSNYWQAMKVNQTSTAVSNTLPGGGAIAIGVTYSMYSAYGFAPGDIGLSILLTGIWNNFAKLGMPVIALAILAIQGNATSALMVASLAGVGLLAAAVVVFAMVLRSDRLAGRVGERAARIAGPVRKLFRKDTATGWGEGLRRFRKDAIVLLARRWAWLSIASIVSHLSLFLVLLIALRHVGVSEAEVSWAEALAAFAFVRLISALPITPGGLGVIELGLTAALVTAGGPRAEVVASVLVYRALTYVLPVALGTLAYLRYKKGSAARSKRVADAKAAAASAGPR